jgi:Bacterial protein of unknown function (DUF937)
MRSNISKVDFMNLVDILKDQLGGEASKSLGKMSGASEGDISKVLGAGLPSILSGLGALASSKQGAGKIAEAIGGMDSSLFGNLAGMLGGAAGQKGGSMLSNLMTGTVVEGLSNAISKFTGVSPGIVKTILGYLTPLVLGAIGKSFGGRAIDASSVSNLFAQQKSSIAASLPKGFSMDGIQGFAALGGGNSTASRPAPAPVQSGGSGMLKLLPLLAIAAIAGAIYYWSTLKKAADDVVAGGTGSVEKAKEEAEGAVNSATNPVGDGATVAGNAAKGVVEGASKMAGDAAKATTDAVGSAKELVGDAAKAVAEKAASVLDGLKGDFGSMFEGLAGKLGKVSDAAGAEEILPDLKGYAEKLDGMAEGVGALPAEGKSIITEMIKGQMDKLTPIFDKFKEMPGVSEAFTKLIEQIKSALMGLIG